MGKVSTTIVVPKSNKKSTVEKKEVEKQVQMPVSQEEVVNTKVKPTNLDVKTLRYQFYDPAGSLPAQYHAELSTIKKIFYIPYSLLFTLNEDAYKKLIAAGNNYVYAKYDTVSQVPVADYKTVKEFTNDLFDHNKEVVIYVEDVFLHKIHTEIISDLVKSTLRKFNIVYSRISIEPILVGGSKGNPFTADGPCSYVTYIGVHAGEDKVNFIGYSINTGTE